jgi:DNA-binding SARP family transcriptional activator
MTTFDLAVLGGLSLRSAQTGQLIGGSRRKPLALLALLAAAGSDGAERDVLGRQLWPGDESRAAHSLSQALHALRHDLGIAATRSDGSRLFLNEHHVRADLEKFTSAIDRGLWSTAAAAHAGPFLDGVYFKGCAELERWIDANRERLAQAHRMALRHLVDDAIERGETTLAFKCLGDAVLAYPCDAGFALSLARLHESIGNRSQAMTTLRAHAKSLRTELAAQPSPVVAELIAAWGASSEPMLASETRVRGAPSVAARGTTGPTRRLRSFVIAHRISLVTSVVLTAGIALAFAVARDSDPPWSFTEAWTAERRSLIREREHSTRGRVFIETPIVQSPGELDSLGDIVAREITNFVANSRAAHVVPRDSVVSVETAAASEGGWNSPKKRMSRASAPIGVMTVLSIRGDSVRASVVLERLVPPPRVLSHWSFVRFFQRDSSLALARAHDEGLETSPLATVSAPMTRRGAIIFQLARDVVDALDEMRSCSLEKHIGERSVPWCWRTENEPVLVKGYFHAKRQRLSKRDRS